MESKFFSEFIMARDGARTIILREISVESKFTMKWGRGVNKQVSRGLSPPPLLGGEASGN